MLYRDYVGRTEILNRPSKQPPSISGYFGMGILNNKLEVEGFNSFFENGYKCFEFWVGYCTCLETNSAVFDCFHSLQGVKGIMRSPSSLSMFKIDEFECQGKLRKRFTVA